MFECILRTLLIMFSLFHVDCFGKLPGVIENLKVENL